MRFRSVARIVKPYGRKGCVRIEPLVDYQFRTDEKYFLAPPLPQIQFLTINEVFTRDKHLIFCFKEITDRSQAEKLRDRYLQRQLVVKPQSHGELEGYTVLTDDQRRVGTVKDVIESAGYRTIVVQTGEKELLVPFVREYVESIDSARKVIVVSGVGYDELRKL